MAVKVGVNVADTVAVAEIVAVGVTLPVGRGVGESGTQMGPAVRPIPTSGPFTPTWVGPTVQWPLTVTVKIPCSNPAPTCHLTPVKW